MCTNKNRHQIYGLDVRIAIILQPIGQLPINESLRTTHSSGQISAATLERRAAKRSAHVRELPEVDRSRNRTSGSRYFSHSRIKAAEAVEKHFAGYVKVLHRISKDGSWFSAVIEKGEGKVLWLRTRHPGARPQQSGVNLDKRYAQCARELGEFPMPV